MNNKMNIDDVMNDALLEVSPRIKETAMKRHINQSYSSSILMLLQMRIVEGGGIGISDNKNYYQHL